MKLHVQQSIQEGGSRCMRSLVSSSNRPQGCMTVWTCGIDSALQLLELNIEGCTLQQNTRGRSIEHGTQHVDRIVATLDTALAKQGLTTKPVERWKAEMPTEAEMLPKDKYTIFDRKAKRYRKGIHSMWEFS